MAEHQTASLSHSQSSKFTGCRRKQFQNRRTRPSTNSSHFLAATPLSGPHRRPDVREFSTVDSSEDIFTPLLEHAVLSLYSCRKKFLSPVVSEGEKQPPASGFCYEICWTFPSHLSANQRNGLLALSKGSEQLQLTERRVGRTKVDAKKACVRAFLEQLGHPSDSELNEVYGGLVGQEKSRHGAQINERKIGESTCQTVCRFPQSDRQPIEFNVAGPTYEAAQARAKAVLWKRLIESPSSPLPSSHATPPASLSEPLPPPPPPAPELNQVEIGSIMQQSTSMMARLGIQEKLTVNEENGRCRCEASWSFLDDKGVPCVREVVAYGRNQKEAKAQTRLKLLGETGLVEEITTTERLSARKIKQFMLCKDFGSAMKEAVKFIQTSSPDAWLLVLPALWKAILGTYSYVHVEALVAALGMAGADTHRPRPLPVALWSEMLTDCCLLTNGRFGAVALAHLTGGASYDFQEKPAHVHGYQLRLDPSVFPSADTMLFFLRYRAMLAHELRAEISNKAAACRLSDESRLLSGATDRDQQSLLLDVVSVASPCIKLHSRLNPEVDRFLGGIRVDDLVLIRPSLLDERSSWAKACVVRVSNVAVKEASVDCQVKLVTAESNDEILNCPSFFLYTLSTLVSNERMVNALKALCHTKLLPDEKRSSMYFTPEMRFLLLNSDSDAAKNVAKNCAIPSEFAASFAVGSPMTPPTKKRTDESQRQHTNPKKWEEVLQSTMETLTPQQQLAVDSAMTNRITLIQGPPGTGKTHVACSIVKLWYEADRGDKTRKILVVADSNVAADNLSDGLKNRDVPCVRVGAGSDVDLKEFRAGQASLDDPVYQSEYSKVKAHRLERMRMFRSLVMNNQIIITTCIGSGHPMYEEVQFDRVIVDECGQSTEPASLVALARGCSNLVLVGDFQQLPATILSSEAESRGLSVSLLERLSLANLSEVILLDVQRRMHPSIAEFPNCQFYKGKLKNQDVDDRSRPPVPGFVFPNPAIRICFVKVQPKKAGVALEASDGSSKYNQTEARLITQIIQSVLGRKDLDPHEIGILTPYGAQKRYIKRVMANACSSEMLSGLEIDTIDGFQGKEKELIIFSAVRSNTGGHVGFLSDGRRMNVMLTRARRGLIVVGDPDTLKHEERDWALWLEWIESRQSAIPADKLKEYLGSYHPDPQKAENAVRAVLEGRVTNLWPTIEGAGVQRPSHVSPLPGKQKCLYVDDDEEEAESDDEDWYGEG